MRLTCVGCAPVRGVWGHAPQKNVKIQGFAGAFWSGFDSSELKVQMTCAHTARGKCGFAEPRLLLVSAWDHPSNSRPPRIIARPTLC